MVGFFRKNTQNLDLIRLEFAVRKGRICDTAPMLAPPLNPAKPKLLDPVVELMRRVAPREGINILSGELTFVTFLTL
jgi:hypothetical protein